MGLSDFYPSISDTWVNYGTYGANWNEFQKDRDFAPVGKFAKCFAKCMVLGHGYSYPIAGKVVEEGITHLMKHHPKSPMFLRGVGHFFGWAGWIYFGYESFECMKQCGEENECH